MAEEKAGRFPDPHEYQTPAELEGWEEMYPSHYLFSKDREEWEKGQFWYQDKIHDPEPMPPLDLIFHEAWGSFRNIHLTSSIIFLLMNFKIQFLE